MCGRCGYMCAERNLLDLIKPLGKFARISSKGKLNLNPCLSNLDNIPNVTGDV